MTRMLYHGEGINLKTETGKPIKFGIPDSITKRGLESIQKNLQVTGYQINPTHPHFMNLPKDAFLPSTNPDLNRREEREVEISIALSNCMTPITKVPLLVAMLPERGKRAFQFFVGKPIYEASISEIVAYAYGGQNYPRESHDDKKLGTPEERTRFWNGVLKGFEEMKLKTTNEENPHR